MREKDEMWNKIVARTDLIHATFLKDFLNHVGIVELLEKGGLGGLSITHS